MAGWMFTCLFLVPVPTFDELAGGAILDRQSAIAAELDAYLNGLATRGFHGTVQIEHRGRVVLKKGYGWTDESRRYPVTPKTLFYTASMAKTMTAMLILKLGEKGGLHLTDELGSFFPEAPAALKTATLHHLLTHTAGLRSKYAADGFTRREQAVRAVFEANPNPEPGSFFYTNDGYALLAAIIETATGERFEAVLQREFLDPAGMKTAKLWGRFDDLNAALVAQKQTDLDEATRQPNWGYLGSGGVYATATDLSHMWHALRSGEIIGPASQQIAWRSHLTRDGLGVGYGWFRTVLPDGSSILWSRGTEDFGHGALLQWYERAGLLAIILTRSGLIDGEWGHRCVGHKVQDLVAGH